MDVLQSFLLGLIQGLTEFLPISSSGHLVLGRYLLGANTNTGITFEVVVHFGTLCSILVYFRQMLADLTISGFQFLKSPKTRSADPQIHLLMFILVSMIPAMIVGFTLEKVIEDTFMDPLIVSGMILVTGCILFLTKFAGEKQKPITVKNSLIIGFAQAIAILPGISRSGSTISTALYLGVRREDAANFSFLMVIPVITGAMMLKVKELLEVGVSDTQMLSLIVGFFTAFVSGYYALKYLILILKKRGFHYFAYYCWIVGGIGLIYFL